MTTLKKQRIQALIHLLDDPDPAVFEAVEKELLKENTRLVPELEIMWETTPHEICQLRIENLIQRIQFKANYQKLRLWSRQQTPDLLEGFILASRYHFPDLNTDRVYRKIEEIRKRVWIELNNSLTSLEKITVLNHILYNEYKFTAVADVQPLLNYYSVSHILETHTGSTVAIAMLYNIIACKLALPVRYVDFPRNPMLAYVDRRIAVKVYPPEVETDILFYINPANDGSITGRREMEYLLRKIYNEESGTRLETTSPRFFLMRLLEMTEKAYGMSGQSGKSADIQQMIHILSEKNRSRSTT